MAPSSRTARTTDKPRERLLGDLDPLRPLGKLRAPVVARRVAGDQPELDHVGLQRGHAGHRLDAGRHPDHLVHPRPLLGSGEVGPHPGPDVLGLADVEHVSLLIMLGDEQVDPGPIGQVGGPGPLGPALRRHPSGELTRSSIVCTPRLPTRSISPCSTSTVAWASVSARWFGVTAARKCRASVASRQLAPRRAAGSAGPAPRCRPPASGEAVLQGLAGPAQEAHVERRVVRHDHRALGEGQERRQHLAERGRVGDHLIGDPGQHRDQRRDRGPGIDQGLELAEHLAAADLDRAELGDHVGLGAAGGLQVDHAERHLRQVGAQILERCLCAAVPCRDSKGPP